MKKIFLFLVFLASTQLVNAQVNFSIGSGAYFIVSGAPQVVMDTGNFVNNGTYMDNTGVFKASGGVAFSGSGTTHMNNLSVSNSQTTNVNATVSVYNTATLSSGKLNANNNLYIRSDANTVANMVVVGVLNNTVNGIIARASVTSSASCTPYTSNLTLNISGPAMVYQWQSSSDNSTWVNVSGATNATYTATVVATIYYRCSLSTNNSGYTQNTPGVQLLLSGALPAITGTTIACVGATTTLSNAVSGGTWTSGTIGVATVNASSGDVTGVSAGTTAITYTSSAGCTAARVVTVNANPSAITGSNAICMGTTTTLSNSTGGGVSWTSSNAGVATIGSSSGLVTSVNVGVTTITYLVTSGCYATLNLSVNTTPAAITGTATVCAGNTATFTSSGSGLWTSSNTAIAGVGSTTGVVQGNAGGTATITYTIGSCTQTRVVTVTATPTAITGTTTFCAGTTTTLTSTPAGGTWSSSNTGVATAGTTSTGLITGISAGTSTITYSVGIGCITTTAVSVSTTPSVITGTLLVCVGSSVTLSNPTPGGTWSSGSTAIATIGSGTGIVNGVAGGTSNISYTVAGCRATAVATVSASPAAITGATSVCAGATVTFTHSTSGGTWTSSNVAKATVGLSTGVVTGVAAGVATITYFVTPGCYKTKSITVNGGSQAITGSTTVCVGATGTLVVTGVSGASWVSTNTSVATIGSTSGVVTGIAAGTSPITYAGSTGCTSTTVVTVLPLPTPISGTLTLCQGTTTTLASVGTTGGTWLSSVLSKATVGSSSGVVTGLAGGTSNITYTWTNGCRRSAQVTVNPSPVAGAIVGVGIMSVTSTPTQTLTASSPGGTWTSATPSVATIGLATGFMSAVSVGNVRITYTVTNTCGTAFVTRLFSVVSGRAGSPIVSTGADVKFNVYPNPTSGIVTIESPVTGVFSVYTIDGKLVSSYTITDAKATFTLSNHLTAGTYICRFNGDDGSTVMTRLLYEP